MGLSRNRRESHVLKLVHPGGFVELHTKPVMAVEVMNKNPRHFVTRPDIFRFPWIVVSPESILRPGSVFFIVPCRTIRDLSKSTTLTHLNLKHHQNQDSHSHSYSHRGGHNKISNSNKNQHLRKQSYSSMSSSMSCMKPRTPRDRESGQKQRKEGVDIQVQSLVMGRPAYYSSEDVSVSGDVGMARPWSSGCLSHTQQVSKLKSCLKKDKSDTAGSRNLKARFAFTDEDVNNTTKFTTNICPS